MRTYNCIIVDDETLAQDLIETHLKKIPNTQIISKCHTAMEAIQALNEHHIDIMFLDIEMPDLTGIELLRSLDKPPLTVLTTAYSEYALESYELNVVDYLLKPVRFDRFFKAITKVLALLKGSESEQVQKENEEESEDYIFVKSEYKAVKVKFKNIVFIESMQKYVRFHLKDKKVMSLMSLSSVIDILPATKFFRCHKSYIINLNEIESIDGNLLIMSSEDKIPVSKSFKSELINIIDKNKLL